MTNLLARQRLGLFAETYARDDYYPLDNLLNDSSVVQPTRAHFMTQQQAVIDGLISAGVLLNPELQDLND